MYVSYVYIRAKLASLFSLDQAESQGDESFKYTAPKQPKKNTSTATPGGYHHTSVGRA